MVICKTCFVVEEKEKLLVSKLDIFDKHSRMCKCLVTREIVDVEEYFFCPTNAHVKSMHTYFVHNLKQALEASHLVEIFCSPLENMTKFLNKI
jgi:hypothetical protein